MTKIEKLLFLAIRYGHEEIIDRLDFMLSVILLFAWKLNLCEWYWCIAMFALTFMQFLYGLFFGYQMKKLMKEVFGTLDEDHIPIIEENLNNNIKENS